MKRCLLCGQVLHDENESIRRKLKDVQRLIRATYGENHFAKYAGWSDPRRRFNR